MKSSILLLIFAIALAGFSALRVNGESPYRFFTWIVTYATISPLGLPQQVSHNSILQS